MTIHELVSLIPAERIGFQVLSAVMLGASNRKHGGTEIKFATDAVSCSDVALGTGRRGLILWFDADDWKKIQDAAQEAK